MENMWKRLGLVVVESEGLVVVEPPNWNVLILFIQIEKKNFFKKDTFNEASNPQTLHHSKIGPAWAQIAHWQEQIF